MCGGCGRPRGLKPSDDGVGGSPANSELGCQDHVVHAIAKCVNDALTILAGDTLISLSRHHSREADVRMRTKYPSTFLGQLVSRNPEAE